jgi:hypothetical protein
MAVPRPVLIGLLGIALCLAAFMATRGASDNNGAVSSSPPPVTPAPSKQPATKAGADKPSGAAKQANKPEAKKAAPADTKGAAKNDSKASTPSKDKPKAATPAPAEKPAPTRVESAAAALARGDVAIFFFTRAGSADDAGTQRSVKALHGIKRVSIFRAGLGDLATFRSIVSGAGVSQVPSVVIVKSGEKAQLLEGFVDPKTLRQAVADARR